MRRLIVYSALYAGTAAFQKLLGFGIFLWLARMLSVEQYARFGLLYALQQGFATLASAGVVEAVVGQLRTYQSSDARSKLFGTATLTFLILIFVAGVLGILVWYVIPTRNPSELLPYVSVIVSGSVLALTSFQSQLARLDAGHLWSVLLNTVPVLSALLGGFAAFVLTPSLTAFFGGTALCVLVVSCGLWIFHRRLLSIDGARSMLRPLLLQAAPYSIVALLGWLSGYGNNYIIKLVLPDSAVARYTFALSLCSVMLLVSGALNQVWSPRFYDLARRQPFELIERQNQSFYRMLALALGFAGGLVTLVFPAAMRTLGGNLVSYQDATVPLALLLSGYVILTPWWHCQNYLMFHGMGRSILKITLITSTIGISLLLLMMWVLGPIGIYIGFALQMILRSVAITLEARKFWPVRIGVSGVTAGLSLIVMGCVLSSVTSSRVLPELVYVVVFVLLAGVFFYRDFVTLTAKQAIQ